jgi:hypothetical protein
MKKDPEYEVKYSAGGAARGSVPRSQSVTPWKRQHVTFMEGPDVLPQAV